MLYLNFLQLLLQSFTNVELFSTYIFLLTKNLVLFHLGKSDSQSLVC